MSYDVSLVIDTGGEHPAEVEEIGNHTSNCAGMWSHALGFPLDELNGQPAGSCAFLLRAASEAILRNPDVYDPMNPENGWGSRESAGRFLATFADACARHPKATVRISR